MDRNLNFAAIDFETANREPNSACAIGVSIVRDGRLVDTVTSLIKPPSRYFEFTYIHGLTWQDVRKAPDFGEVWQELWPLIADLDHFAAHNAPFDRKVLQTCCRAHGIPVPEKKFVCTVQVARAMFSIRPTKLPNVCARLDIPLNHHDAHSDAEACARILIAAAAAGWNGGHVVQGRSQ